MNKTHPAVYEKSVFFKLHHNGIWYFLMPNAREGCLWLDRPLSPAARKVIASVARTEWLDEHDMLSEIRFGRNDDKYTEAILRMILCTEQAKAWKAWGLED